MFCYVTNVYTSHMTYRAIVMKDLPQPETVHTTRISDRLSLWDRLVVWDPDDPHTCTPPNGPDTFSISI
jgi:hypothetical protein